jgi:hypothetical protein
LRATLPLGLFVLAAVLRLHDAWLAAPLSGFDGPYHAAYLGVIHWEGRLPLPDEGWSTNHPPFYYGLCALVWWLLPSGTSPWGVLLALRLVNVAAGLALGAAIWSSAHTLFPQRPRTGLFALSLGLFTPMLIGPSVLLGNEMLATALSAAAVALLLRCLADPRPSRTAAAGVVAGLGVATKLSALVVVLAGVGSLLVRGGQRAGRSARALAPAALLGGLAFLVSSPYFVRNVVHYGAPILTKVEISVEVMRRQGYGEVRPWSDYLDLHPGSVLRPGKLAPRANRAVWPVTFSTIWFDPHGTLLDVHAPAAQWLARVLYLFGLVFTAAAGLGAIALARRRAEAAVPLGALMLGLLAVLGLAGYVAFTRSVATHSVLKGTYLSPTLTAFVLYAALGLDLLAERGRVVARVVSGAVAVFVACVLVTFWYGGIAPMRVNPADFYLDAYRDAPTERAFRYFVGREPARGRAPRLDE